MNKAQIVELTKRPETKDTHTHRHMKANNNFQLCAMCYVNLILFLRRCEPVKHINPITYYI